MLNVFYWLGRMDYDEAYRIQDKLWAEKMNGRADNAVLLLEHPPTFTLGKSGKLQNLLLSREELAGQGISLRFTDRGGDITYHGPGQLVMYPIIDLRQRGKDVHRYVHNLEDVAIRTLAGFSIDARKDEKYIGAWVGDEKIAAIGVRIKRWITMHGMALNVNPQMEHFSFINPCGIRDRGVTSMAKLLSRDVPMETVVNSLAGQFAEVFDTDLQWGSAETLRCG